MATFKLLDSITVGAGGASSVTFSNIPQTYTDLKIVYSCRNSNVYNEINFRLNSVNSSYAGKILTANSSSVSQFNSSSTEMQGTLSIPTGYTANTFSNGEIYITNYASSYNKAISINSVQENNASLSLSQLGSGLWSNTSAITSINIFPATETGTLAQYSTFYLYGIWADSSTGTPSAPTIGTATAGNTTASVAFTPAGSGNTAVYYQAISTPGSITGTGTSSPITVSGLTNNTSYTFKVAGVNPIGTGTYSAASNSVTPIPASYYSVQTITVDSGGASSITFSSIPQTYTHLQIRMIVKNTSADYETKMRVGNGSPDSGTNYADHYLLGNGASVYANATTSATSAIIGIEGNTTNNYSAYVCDILDYRNQNKYKTFRTLNGVDKNGSGSIRLQSGLWQSTAAIDTIYLFHNSGSFAEYSSFALYGVI